MSFFKKLSEGLKKTKDNMVRGFEDAFKTYTKVDDQFLEELEDILITLDGIINSGYIPFASPSPSSTEKVVKQSIKNAKAELECALEFHNSLYKR